MIHQNQLKFPLKTTSFPKKKTPILTKVYLLKINLNWLKLTTQSLLKIRANLFFNIIFRQEMKKLQKIFVKIMDNQIFIK